MRTSTSSRAALEAIALQAYRERKLSTAQENTNRAADHPHISLVQENGLLVHLGKAPQGFDWDRLVDDEREARLRDISRL